MSDLAAAPAPVPTLAFPPTPGLADLAARLPRLRGRLTPGAELAPFTWFRVGGPAEMLFAPADEDDLAYVLAELPAEVPVTVLAIASNVIVRDGGIPGLVVRLPAKGFGAIDVVSEREILAGAAAPDRKVAGAAAEAGLGGLEFLFGIPGSIGGALRMNAGANGGETKDVVVYATGVNRAGDAVTLSNAEMGFRYRGVDVDPSVIFTGALLRGVPDDDLSIRARMEAVKTHRETAQPIREKTGGSTFKNPPGQSAWKLIDAAGCRGLRVGGAQVSEMHCNFLINTGAATAADVEALGEEVRRRVRESSGVELEWEIKRIGVDAQSI